MLDSTNTANAIALDEKDVVFATDLDLDFDGLDLDLPFDESEIEEGAAAPTEEDTGNTHTTEERTLDELREAASVALAHLNAAYKTDSMSKIAKAKQGVDEAINEYNKAYIDELFSAYLEDESPVLSAVRDGFCRVLRMVEKTTKDGARHTELDYATRVIDLQGLDKKAGERVITKVARWEAYSERLAYVFAIRATRDIGGDTEKLIAKYRLSEYGRSLRFGDDKARASEPDSMKSLSLMPFKPRLTRFCT